MQLEEVRKLKGQIRRTLLSRVLHEYIGAKPNFTVGVGLTDTDNEYQLAVRVSNEADSKWFQDEYAELLNAPGVDLNIRAIGELKRAPEVTAPDNPTDDLSIGMRVRHFDHGHFGTLGFFARQNGTRGFVSCNHVIAKNDVYKPLDAIRGGISDRIIGKLGKVHKLRKNIFRKADCAYAIVPDEKFPTNPNVLGTDGRLDTELPILRKLLPVIKIGAKTERTTGRIISFENDDHLFDYDNFFATFPNVIEIESTTKDASGKLMTFSDPGDSGSLIYTEDRKPVGLLFFETTGGPDNTGVTYANPISQVLSALKVSIL